jgi:hypothetical protein
MFEAKNESPAYVAKTLLPRIALALARSRSKTVLNAAALPVASVVPFTETVWGRSADSPSLLCRSVKVTFPSAAEAVLTMALEAISAPADIATTAAIEIRLTFTNSP